jgi:hypothetical protein
MAVALMSGKRLGLRTHGAGRPVRDNLGVSIVQRPASAALGIALGVVALFVGASLLMLRDGGWPWHASIGGRVGVGSTTAEILDEDGTLYRFTGSPAAAQDWLDSKQDELMDAHGISARIAVGRVMQPVGLAFVVLGFVRLLWQLVTVRRARSAFRQRERWPSSSW